MSLPFGSWKSPITPDLALGDAVSFYDMQSDAEHLYWTELDPKEGKVGLVRYDGNRQERLIEHISIRTRVHEYGGGAICLSDEGCLFSNDADRQLYLLSKEGEVTELTHARDWRFADGSGPFWVGEYHGPNVENVLVQLDGLGEFRVVASGHDFYSSPRLSPGGDKLAYITWDFPDMQWDNSTLWLSEVKEDGRLGRAKLIAGGDEESVCQLSWSPQGVLHFVSDRTGFWNLYRLNGGEVECLCEMKADFANPSWVFGRLSYAFLPDGKIIVSYAVKGVDRLGEIDPETKTLKDLQQPFTYIQCLNFYQGKIYFFGATPTLRSSLVCYDPSSERARIIKQGLNLPLGEEWISEPELIEYPSPGGVGYALYYPPKNPDVELPEGETPPLIVEIHGGPTGRAYPMLSLDVQYWTSRGFGFVDVNYGGSSGYGREYLKRLEGNWGVLDVADGVAAAKKLVAMGRADEKRLLIRGASAGGYTALAALTTEKIFSGAVSYFGISDLELLYQDGHKFEARYTDRLVAPYPEGIDLIRSRSPINQIDQINAPILLLQGMEDKVVPPNQSIAIYDALKAKGMPVGILLFEGEGHGFRQAANIKRALEAELYFYGEILGITIADSFLIPPVEIKRKVSEGE